ncbi:MAG: YegS/Rv2252/BmrU family lipid kinase [Solobacterium sp.]|nr:YegS/Rv2252/BmrU family lipid kinase [Solobacterium sp.]
MFEIIVNPAGASGKTLKTWKTAEQIIRKYTKAYNVHYSSENYGIAQIVRDLTGRQKDTDIIVFGGDGSMNEAINGIQDFERTRIGFISCGSGNDLYRSLEIHESLEQRLQIILQKNTVRELDVGELTYYNCYDADGMIVKATPYTRRFNISCGIGFDAAVCANAASDWKKVLNKLHLGQLIYIATAVNTIIQTKRVPARITSDGVTREFPKLLFAVVMNQPFEGGGFKFAPEAKGDDRKLDLCVADGLTQFDFFRMFPFAYSGNHIQFHGVYISRAEKTEIETDIPLWVHTDGEIEYMSDHISMKLLDQKLRMLI